MSYLMKPKGIDSLARLSCTSATLDDGASLLAAVGLIAPLMLSLRRQAWKWSPKGSVKDGEKPWVAEMFGYR